MMHAPNETCRMSGSSIFSSGAMPVVALWYQVGFLTRLWEDVLLSVNWQCAYYSVAVGGETQS